MTAFRQQLDPPQKSKWSFNLTWTQLWLGSNHEYQKAAGTTFGMRWLEYNKSVICSYCSAFEQRWDEFNNHSGIHSLLPKVPNLPHVDCVWRTWRAHTETESQCRDSAWGLKYLGVLILREGRMEQQVDRCSVCNNAVTWLMSHGDEEAKVKGGSLSFLVYLCNLSHGQELWVMTRERGGRYKSFNDLPVSGGWARVWLPLGSKLGVWLPGIGAWCAALTVCSEYDWLHATPAVHQDSEDRSLFVHRFTEFKKVWNWKHTTNILWIVFIWTPVYIWIALLYLFVAHLFVHKTTCCCI